MGNLWSLATFIGPILLIVAIVWAISRNRRQTPEEIARTERATHDNIEQTDREDHERDRHP